MTKSISFLITLVVLISGVVLGVLNPNLVTFDAFFGVYEIPLSILLASVLVSGLLLGSGLMLSSGLAIRWKLNKQIKLNKLQSDQILQLKKEVTGLKSQISKPSESKEISLNS